MKTKFPFKNNKIAALLLLAPLGAAQAEVPYFSENSTLGSRFDYLYSPTQVADSTHLNLTINKLNNEYITSHQTGNSISAITSVDGSATPVVTTSINSSNTRDHSNQRVIVNPLDNSLILAYSSTREITILRSTDNGITWVDQPSITTTTAAIKAFDIIINDQGEAFIFFLDTSANFGSGEIYSYDFSSESPANIWTQETHNQIKTFAYEYDTETSFSWVLNSEGRPSLLVRDDGTLDTYGDDNEFTSDPLLAGTKFFITVISQNADGDWSALGTSGTANRPTYFDAAYDSNNVLYVFHSNLVDPSGQVSKLTGSVFSRVGPDYITTSLIDANLDENPDNDVANNGRNDYVKRLKIAIDSNDVPYVAFQQIKNTLVAGKQQVQVARYDDVLADWIEVIYDLESTDITSGSSATAVHDSFDFKIDNLDRPVLYVKTGGDSNDGFAKVLRVNNTTPGTNSLAYSINEGELVVGSLTGRDADGDEITYTITDDLIDEDAGSAAALFIVDKDNDQLKFKTPVAAKVTDTNEVYNLTVTATANGESTSIDIEVTLVNTSNDSDNDTIPDNIDETPFGEPDSDLDGVVDSVDAFPLDANEQYDTDGDGVGDNADAFPEDASEQLDSDGDGIGDNTDFLPDDASEQFDVDGDGLGNNADAFPFDVNEKFDSDQDGLGNNSDAFPYDATEQFDSDGDGIGDNADVYPNDASEQLDTDGDGVGDNADALPNDANEQSDTDGDGVGDNADAFPNDASEQLDTDGDGYGDNIDPDPTNPADVSAPVITLVNEQVGPFVIDAAGLNTEVNGIEIINFINDNFTATDQLIPGDDRDDNISVVIASDANTNLASGVQTVKLSSTDSTGNIGYFDLAVHINPIVQLGADSVVEAGATLSVPVKLQGQAPVYPVELMYSVTPSGTGVTSEEQTLVIAASDKKPVINYVLSTEQSGETVEVTLISATNATVIDEASDVGGLAKPSVTANVISGNIAPVVSFMISQAEAGDNGAISNVSTIAGAGGLVTVTANISDINTKDEHCITFTSLDSSLVESVDMADECRLLNTFTFDPSTLTSGTYTLETSVVESNTDVPFTTEVSIKLAVIAGSVEVIADSDSDGVPDSQENTATMNDATQLPVKDDEAPLQIAAGLSLSLGDIAKSNTDNNGFVATVERDQVQDDLHYSAISTITNFNVSGLQQLGDSVSVVIPLAEDVVIPANAVYRKYTELNGDWFDFVIDENNQVASAFKDAQGNCPAPNSVNYSTGLTEGNGCIQLTIEDGGLNDGDSMANGRIVDPGVLVIENENTPPEIISLTTHATNSGDEFSLNAIVVDLEQDEITYSWGQVDTGSTLLADVVEANTKTGVFIAPVTAEPTELTFSLTITDSYGGSSSKEFVVKVETINLKPDHEVDRKAGSFGCFFVLITLAGLVTRRIRKYK